MRQRLPPAFLEIRMAKKMNTVNAPAVSSISLNTLLAATGASRHTNGSKNLPKGNQPSLKAKVQIIISANQGVNTVNKVAPEMVAVYSMIPPRRQAIAFPNTNPR